MVLFMTTVWRLIETALRTIALLALASLVVLPALQVVLRDVFTSPIVGLEEATRWGLITLVFAAAPLLISTNEQIRLTEFIAHLPERLRGWLERITLLAGGVACAIIAWAGMASALKNASTRTPTLDIPFWLFALPMVIGLAAAAIGYLWVALRPQSPPSGTGNPSI